MAKVEVFFPEDEWDKLLSVTTMRKEPLQEYIRGAVAYQVNVDTPPRVDISDERTVRYLKRMSELNFIPDCSGHRRREWHRKVEEEFGKGKGLAFWQRWPELPWYMMLASSLALAATSTAVLLLRVLA